MTPPPLRPWLEKLHGLSKVTGKEVTWMPGPKIPKLEVFRGRDKLFPKTQGGREICLPPLPTEHRPGPQRGPQGGKPHVAPSALPAEQLAGGPYRSSCQGAGPLPPLGTRGTRPYGTSWNREQRGSLPPSPFLTSRASDRRDSGPDPRFLCPGLKGGTNSSLPSGNPTGAGAVWACCCVYVCVCVLACSCFYHF